MNLQAALLCASAVVRDGRLSLLDAGVTDFSATRFPMSLEASLAVVVNADPEDRERLHDFVASVHEVDEHGFVSDCPVAHLKGEFIALSPSAREGEGVNVPLAFDLRAFAIPSPGTYEIRVTIDGELLAILPLSAVSQCR